MLSQLIVNCCTKQDLYVFLQDPQANTADRRRRKLKKDAGFFVSIKEIGHHCGMTVEGVRDEHAVCRAGNERSVCSHGVKLYITGSKTSHVQF
jgi:hypothetical protein